MATQEDVCRLCGESSNSGKSLELWDGNRYCSKCLEHAAPELVDFALSNPQLEETRSESVNATLPRYSSYRRAMVISLLFYVIAFTWLALSGNIFKVIGIIVFCMLLGKLIFGYWLYLNMSPFHQASDPQPRVSVRDGIVKLHKGERLLYAAKLANCEWIDLSKSKYAKLGSPGEMCREFLVLVLPRAWWLGVDKAVLCGFTSTTRNIWVNFLTIASVPQRGADVSV